MSDKSDNNPARTLGQENSTDKCEKSEQDRFYSAWATVGEVIALILTCAAARLIGKRIEMLAEGGWLPGMGDTRTIAALTNRSDRSIEEVTSSTPRHKYHNGRQVFYRLSDFAVPAAPPETPPNDAPAKHTKRKSK